LVRTGSLTWVGREKRLSGIRRLVRANCSSRLMSLLLMLRAEAAKGSDGLSVLIAWRGSVAGRGCGGLGRFIRANCSRRLMSLVLMLRSEAAKGSDGWSVLVALRGSAARRGCGGLDGWSVLIARSD